MEIGTLLLIGVGFVYFSVLLNIRSGPNFLKSYKKYQEEMEELSEWLKDKSK